MKLSHVIAGAAEVLRAVAVLPRAERARLRLGPRAAAESMRVAGRRRPRREDAARARLQRAIRLVDRHAPRLLPTFVLSGGANCYRRALMEMALDAGAAREPLMMGFHRGGGPGSGHAWLGSHPDEGGAFTVVAST